VPAGKSARLRAASIASGTPNGPCAGCWALAPGFQPLNGKLEPDAKLESMLFFNMCRHFSTPREPL
jgi:hypothetical protein